MKLLVNGKDFTTENSKVLDLIAELQLNIEGIVVLHNDNVVKKSEYENLILKENDRLELLNFVSGG